MPAKEGQEAMLPTLGRIVHHPQRHRKLLDYVAINAHDKSEICKICKICTMCVNMHKFHLHANMVFVCNLYIAEICKNM